MTRALIGLLAGLSLACSAVNDPEAHLPEPLDATQFCEAYANVVCDGVIDCCDAAGSISRAACVAQAGVLCTERLGPLISDPRSGYDDAEAGLQLARGRLLARRCDVTFNRWLARRDGLMAIFTGSVDRGGSCGPIVPEDFTTVPIQIDAPRFVSCGTELACRADVTFTEWNCLAPAGVGDACTLGDCETGLTCWPTSGATYECIARLPDGAACWGPGNCESYDCGCNVDRTVCSCRPDDTRQQVYCGLAGL